MIAGILLLFLALRIRHFNQLLTWDEAQFALVVRAFSLGLKDAYAVQTGAHPPGYLLLCAFLYKYMGLWVLWFRAVSLLFAAGSLLLTYFLARKLISERVALIAIFFFAVMPAATVMDTWVKQDSMATFFMLLAVLLFVKEKYFYSGIALGAGLLTKETAIFALATMGVFSLVSRDRARIKGVVITGAVSAALSFWWYVWLASRSGEYLGFFRGTTDEALHFAEPWYYYLKGAVTDTGLALAVLLALGLLISIYKGMRGNKYYLLPVIWVGIVYLVISISVGKPYWMITSAIPALAIVSAVGLDSTATVLERRLFTGKPSRYIVAALIAVVLSLALFAGITTEYAGYNPSRSVRYWSLAAKSTGDGETVDSVTGEGDLVYALFYIERDPIFILSMGEADYVPLTAAILDSPESLAESCLKESGTKVIYLNKILLGRPIQKEIARFLERFGEIVPFTIIKDDDYSIIILVDAPPRDGN